MCKHYCILVNHKYHQYVLVITVLLSFFWQISSKHLPPSFGNPNIPCLGRNMYHKKTLCKYGNYTENYDPINCPDITVCYRGIGENCDRNNRCAENAICTNCGKCRKCEGPDNCSGFELCPNKDSVENWFSIFQKRLMEYNDSEE